jgi:hypothetical protein
LVTIALRNPTMRLTLITCLWLLLWSAAASAYDQRWPDYEVLAGNRGSSGTATYFQGFESPCFGPPYQPGAGELDWIRYYSEVVRVASGSGGVASADGFNHAEVLPPLPGAPGVNTGAYTRLGGYRSNFGGGFTVDLDVYFDLSDPRVSSGINADYGWDATSGINDQAGAHLRDFVFHAASNDAGQILLGSSNISAFAPVGTLASGPHAVISSSGWYTLQWVFRDAGDGSLAVDTQLLDTGAAVLWTQTLNEPTDLIASVVGGNRYLWFVFVQSDRLRLDNVRLNSAVREAAYASLPVAGSVIDLGSANIGSAAPDASLNLLSQGSLRLEICSCALSGPGAADFNVSGCPALIEPGNTLALALSCTPGSAGLRSATLTVVTNDSDLGTDFNYPLQCNGIDPNAINVGVPVPLGDLRWLLGTLILLSGALVLRARRP